MNQFNTKIAEQHIKNRFDPEKARKYAELNHEKDKKTILCAEFVSDCLRAGGEPIPKIKLCSDLMTHLQKNDWEKIECEGTGPLGAVVIYYQNPDGSKITTKSGYHAAMSLGNGKITQHNASRYDKNGIWGKYWVFVHKE